jgi:hypothetical protein
MIDLLTAQLLWLLQVLAYLFPNGLPLKPGGW